LAGIHPIGSDSAWSILLPIAFPPARIGRWFNQSALTNGWQMMESWIRWILMKQSAKIFVIQVVRFLIYITTSIILKSSGRLSTFIPPLSDCSNDPNTVKEDWWWQGFT
jgi:hypothetical protein